ncbi:MAG: TIGR00725 family protein [Candidatus Altiarchaeota archaeon]
MKPNIGVIGRDGKIPRKIEKISEEVGAEIAKNNAILICGGRGGVMEASCRGAKKFNGLTIGILPSLEKNSANKYVDVAITTSLNYGRNLLVVTASDVIIAIDGSIGTLSEIALALNYKKPIILIEKTGGATKIIKEKISELKKFEDDEEKLKVYSVKNAKDAVKLALKLID